MSVAALNAVKGLHRILVAWLARAYDPIIGKSMDVDLFSMVQRDKRYISFMCQSLGLMANLDLGTEHLRFMGSQYVRLTRSVSAHS